MRICVQPPRLKMLRSPWSVRYQHLAKGEHMYIFRFGDMVGTLRDNMVRSVVIVRFIRIKFSVQSVIRNVTQNSCYANITP